MTNDEIRRVIGEAVHLELAGISDHEDLYEAGMSSHESVNLMLAVETACGVQFPDEMLNPSVFRTVSSIAAAVTELQAQAA
jgi:acyl carrier protein